MQIAYKIFLGSEKDLEDAKHLFELFREDLKEDEILILLKELNVKRGLDLIK